MSKEAEKEYTQARVAYAALVDMVGRGKNATDRRRLAAAEARLEAAKADLDTDQDGNDCA